MLLKNFVKTAILAVLFNACMKGEKVDVIIHNGNIYTLNAANTKEEAIAIKDGKIIEVGPERQILNKYRADEIIDAEQQFIYPGFIDAHCHFLGYGLNLEQVQLYTTTSFDEVLEQLKIYAETHPEGWILGRGWDQSRWENKNFPTKDKLDSLFPNRPVYLTRIDGHAALVNSHVLDMGNISASTKVNGGAVVIENNEPTGLLVDNAMSMVRKLIPEPSIQQKIDALLKAQEACFKYGLTTVDDAGLYRDDVLLIDSLQMAGDLKMKVYAMLSDNEDNFNFFVRPIKTERLNVRSFKFYGDGALGSRGACLLRPYSDVDSAHYGALLSAPEHFLEKAKWCYERGFQMNTHCIGDSANRIILNTYAEVLDGINDKRWRIEHAQIVDSNDFYLFQENSIIPSVQPTHATSDMRWAALRVGRKRIKYGYAYKMLLEQNGMVALGTDFPIEGVSPIETFYAAVARKDKSGKPEEGFQLDNALTREEALRGMTIWAAMSNFEENEKGTLQAGKAADIVILNQDILSVPQNQLLKTRISATFVNGEKVY